MTLSKLLLPRLTFTALVLLCFGLFAWGAYRINYVPIPEQGNEVLLYANYAGDDLRATIAKAIDGAEQSVTLIIYSLTDPRVINALNERAEAGVKVTVIYDKKASNQIFHKLDRRVHAVPVRGRGLMHQKLLVTDGKLVWIGSANMTSQSLRMHDNLVIGLYNPVIAQAVLNKAESYMRVGIKEDTPPVKATAGEQEVEMIFLPDDHEAVLKIKELVRSAKKTIRIAMFTWTRMDFAKAVAQAAARGVDVQIKMDNNSGNGVGAKVVGYLREHGVPVHLSEGSYLLHHKLMVIDDETLVTGSANWTKAAFTQNDDCIIILNHLNSEQNSKLNKMWEATK